MLCKKTCRGHHKHLTFTKAQASAHRCWRNNDIDSASLPSSKSCKYAIGRIKPGILIGGVLENVVLKLLAFMIQECAKRGNGAELPLTVQHSSVLGAMLENKAPAFRELIF